MTNLDIVKQKVIDAVPEIMERKIAMSIGDGNVYLTKHNPTVRLADVLRAIGKKEKGHLFARADGITACFFKWESFAPKKCHAVSPTYIEWNLSKDLDDQSEDCINFLKELLS